MVITEDSTKVKNNLDVHSKGHNPLYPILSDNPFKAPCPKNIDMRVDPYKIKDKYLAWKQKTDSGIPEITEMQRAYSS